MGTAKESRNKTSHSSSNHRISYFSLTAGGSLLALQLRDRFGGTAHLPRCHSLGCSRCDPFDSIAEALPERFRAGDTLVCIMAAGIVFRVLGPHLQSKQGDPAVIVLDEDGRHVIPLLGGHAAGANDLSREIAAFLGTRAAITTSSDVQGLVAPDEVAGRLGAQAADPVALRRISALVVDGRPVCIESPEDPKIEGYGWTPPGGSLEGYEGRLLVTHLAIPQKGYNDKKDDIREDGQDDIRHGSAAAGDGIATACLIQRAVAAGIGCKRGTQANEILKAVEDSCAAAGIDPRAIGALASIDAKSDEPGLAEAAGRLGVQLIFYNADELAALERPGSAFVEAAVGTPAVSEPAALKAAGQGAGLALGKTRHGPVTVALAVSMKTLITIGTAETPMPTEPVAVAAAAAAADPKEAVKSAEPTAAAAAAELSEAADSAGAQGIVMVIGTGAGTAPLLTAEAAAEIDAADAVFGYRTYIRQLEKILPDKKYMAGSMGAETKRCREALDLAATGRKVAMISSGDPGVYGMAGPLLEMADGIPVAVIPGVTAAQLAAARLGAPLMNDYITLSLSDLLTPREEVLRRAAVAAASDLVICLYNPTSRKRQPLFEEVCALMESSRPARTPVGWVRDAGGNAEEAAIIELAELAAQDIDMRTIVIVGNSRTEVVGGRMVTRRGYRDA